jgi:hypothetical protein
MFDNYNRNRAAREQQERRIRELEKYSRRSTLTGVAAELLTTRLLRQLPDQIRAMLRGRDVSRTTMPDLIGLLKRSLAQLDAASLSESRGMPAPSQMFDAAAYPEIQQRPERRRLPFGWRGDPDDPAYRGQMIAVQSSNVHSIGYQYNDASPSKGVLLVRYLQGSKGQRTAGPQYEYYDIHPAVFDSMRKAASKGGFVWDRLRVRGTVSGHRKQYRLTGFTGSYLPRQAKRYGDREYFVTRSMNATNAAGERRTLTSHRDGRPLRDGNVRGIDPETGYQRKIQSIQLMPGGRRVPLVQR